MEISKIDDKKTIFLSYSWEDFAFANKIENDFRDTGVNIIRDIKMHYKDNIYDFMKRIKDEDYAILLISNNYLRSPNCMREVIEILDNEDFIKKILPVILPETEIFKPKDQLEIIKYWETEIKNLNSKIKELESLANIGDISESIELYSKIRGSIASFVSTIKTLNCKTFKVLEDENYKPILDHIGVVPDDIIALSLKILQISSLSERELEIDKLLEKYPSNGNLIFLKANLALEEKKYKKAEILYKKLIKKNENISDLHNNLGVVYEKQEKNDNAITSYNKAIEINPNDCKAYCNLALLLDEKFQKFEEAEQNYLLSLKCDYFSSITHSNYANLLIKKGDFQKSAFHYEEAVKYHTENDKIKILASIHYGYAHLLHTQLHIFDKAKIHYQECLRLNPTSFQAHCNLAVLLKNIFKDFENTEFHYKEAIKINPKDSITLHNLGNLYQLNLNNNILAKYHYEKAIEFNSDYTNSYNGLGMLFFDDDPIKSKEYFEKALEKDSKFAEAHFNLARLLKVKFNENELAKRHYLAAVTNNFMFHTNMNNEFFNIKSIFINL